MKNLIVALAALIFSNYSFSQSKIEVREGPLINAVDWYVASSIDLFNNTSPTKKIKTFNQIGIVTIRFYNLGDSTEQRREGNEIEMIPHARCQFMLSYESRVAAEHLPPSFYFIRNEVPVAVYSGLERFIMLDDRRINEFRKFISSWEREVNVGDLKEYWVYMDDSFQGGYSIKERKVGK